MPSGHRETQRPSPRAVWVLVSTNAGSGQDKHRLGSPPLHVAQPEAQLRQEASATRPGSTHGASKYSPSVHEEATVHGMHRPLPLRLLYEPGRHVWHCRFCVLDGATNSSEP